MPAKKKLSPQTDSATDAIGRGFWWAVAWFVGYVLVFYSLGLPNSRPAIARWQVWTWLPEILLCNVVPVPGALSGSWLNFPQRIDLLAVALVIWSGAAAIGSLVLRGARFPVAAGSLDRWVLACGLGISLLSLIVLVCGLWGWLSPALLGGGLLLAVVGEIACQGRGRSRHVEQRSWQLPSVPRAITIAALAAFFLAMLLGSLLPSTDFDVKTYHLQGPKEYFQNGQITFLPHNVYTSFPFLTEMLALLAMVLRQDWFRGGLAGQAAVMGFVPLTALSLYCAARRFGGGSVAWLAAVIYFTTPWTYRLAIIPYVEGALSCYTVLALFAALVYFERPDDPAAGPSWKWILLAGWFAGSAMACKYPGLVSVVIPLGMATAGISLMRRRFLTTSWLFGLGVAAAVGLWLLKNLLETGNPVYPLAYELFGGRDWDAVLNQRWLAAHSPPNYQLSDLGRRFLEVTLRSDWLSPLIFGLAPLAWLAVPGRKIPRLATLLFVYLAYLFLTWWFLTHRLDRFWVPMLPIATWLAAIGGNWTDDRRWRTLCQVVVGLAVLFNLGYITTTECGLSTYLADLELARENCETTVEGVQYLNRLYENGEIPRDSRILFVGEALAYDARMPVIYNTAFDHSIFTEWLAERPPEPVPESDWPLRPVAEIRQLFEQHRITHLFVSWEAIVRYRTEGGYSDFVSPARMLELQQSGILDADKPYPRGIRPLDELSPAAQRELLRWGPELHDESDPRNVYYGWQIFAVRK